MFEIAEAKTFLKTKKKLDAKIYVKIKNFVYPILKINPYYGNNIKKLRGDFEGYYRYRVGDYRLFYIIDEKENIVLITVMKHRKDSY